MPNKALIQVYKTLMTWPTTIQFNNGRLTVTTNAILKINFARLSLCLHYAVTYYMLSGGEKKSKTQFAILFMTQARSVVC